ncbi:MAG: hypothetical protein F2534_14940 [Actinobacteria bacterium]|jgi:hypothetical protein|uniref:Unannotated protein n=1 Tax=freshwater metagenome TaxID=449393 RepID=A0A6J6EPY2_9ZZZZ|nr:hypothetical protein [Actinomycetota bacterium]
MSFFPGPFPGPPTDPGPGGRSRIPRARVDPILCADDALSLIALVIHRPLVHETVVIALDHSSRGSVITVVGHGPHHDLCDTLDTFGAVADLEGAAGLVVATVRPHDAIRPGDIDDWLDASALADSWGLVLFEWFVVGPFGAECPRDLIGEPERWWPLAS